MTKNFLKSVLSVTIFASVVVPVLAETSTPSSTATSTPPVGLRPVDVACVQAAIDKRDGAIISAVNSFSGAAVAAIQARTAALKSAWAISDAKARRKALSEAWKTYKETIRKARMDMKKAIRSAWSQFRVDRKACGAFSEEPGGGQGADENL